MKSQEAEKCDHDWYIDIVTCSLLVKTLKWEKYLLGQTILFVISILSSTNQAWDPDFKPVCVIATFEKSNRSPPADRYSLVFILFI